MLFLGIFPKQWYTEGFWRLGKDIHECCGRSPAPVARQLLCTGCGLGEGQVALVHAKRSLAPLSTEKHTCFGTISFRSSSGPPLAQMPPRCLPNVSQMPLRCLSDVSQMPLRCLQMLPPKNCLGSRAGVIFFHELGRRRSSGCETTAVLHGILTRIQWDQFWTLKPFI